ncbi:MAG: flagellar type III secretion system pore protein FliP [Alphaproteobacteria bacterium]|jgi:flagellar biosynthetic protein FliP|nr:flagellar type III secretion system pore protein FliP [Alphaproteobacteria bacterium]
MTRWLTFGLCLVAAALPAFGWAQDLPLNINVGSDVLSSQRVFQLVALITVLSLAPSILMMVTSFTRIVVVFSFLRNAIGLQSSPPNGVMVGLALFLTAFIMAPTFQAAYQQGVQPYLNNQIDETQAYARTTQPFARFMVANVRSEDLELFLSLMPADQRAAVVLPGPNVSGAQMRIPLQALVPAFMISELRRAFEIGFLLFLPFLVIDLAIASILTSMGMITLPPATIALPFKLIFFVLIDGWHLLVGTLVQSFNPPL